MRNVLSIAKREFNMYFASPVAYAVAFALLLIMGIFFISDISGALINGGSPDPTRSVSLFVTLMLFALPAITMGVLAEEQRTGTIELLLTAPVREWELVAGKWLAALGFVSLLIVLTMIYAFIMSRFSEPGLDLGSLAAAYLGVLMLAGALLSVGVFVSSLFSNQIAAFFGIFGAQLLFWIISFPVQNDTGPLAAVLKHLDFTNHFYNSFLSGVVDVTDVLYFVTVIVFFLFLASRVVESRRWR